MHEGDTVIEVGGMPSTGMHSCLFLSAHVRDRIVVLAAYASLRQQDSLLRMESVMMSELQEGDHVQSGKDMFNFIRG